MIAALFDAVEKLAPRAVVVGGLAKNWGKTTALNALLGEYARRGFGLAVTSAGRDGEATDALTLEAKPPIELPGGALAATAEGTLERWGAPFEELGRLGVSSSVGEITIPMSLTRSSRSKPGISKTPTSVRRRPVRKPFFSRAASKRWRGWARPFMTKSACPFLTNSTARRAASLGCSSSTMVIPARSMLFSSAILAIVAGSPTRMGWARLFSCASLAATRVAGS